MVILYYTQMCRNGNYHRSININKTVIITTTSSKSSTKIIVLVKKTNNSNYKKERGGQGILNNNQIISNKFIYAPWANNIITIMTNSRVHIIGQLSVLERCCIVSNICLNFITRTVELYYDSKYEVIFVKNSGEIAKTRKR